MTQFAVKNFRFYICVSVCVWYEVAKRDPIIKDIAKRMIPKLMKSAEAMEELKRTNPLVVNKKLCKPPTSGKIEITDEGGFKLWYEKTIAN